jgi:hypothetical protein
MKILSTAAISTLMFAMLMLGSTESLSQDSCTRESIHNIHVRADAEGVPEVTYKNGSAEEVHVCIGDTIKWVLIGSERKYFVDFLEDAPFGGATRRGSNGANISVTVGGPAEHGSSYKYNVEFEDGGILDPRIVVDR